MSHGRIDKEERAGDIFDQAGPWTKTEAEPEVHEFESLVAVNIIEADQPIRVVEPAALVKATISRRFFEADPGAHVFYLDAHSLPMADCLTVKDGISFMRDEGRPRFVDLKAVATMNGGSIPKSSRWWALPIVSASQAMRLEGRQLGTVLNGRETLAKLRTMDFTTEEITTAFENVGEIHSALAGMVARELFHAISKAGVLEQVQMLDRLKDCKAVPKFGAKERADGLVIRLAEVAISEAVRDLSIPELQDLNESLGFGG